MLFEIHAEKNIDDKKIFYYDNMTNILSDEDGNVFQNFDGPMQMFGRKPYKGFDKNKPLKKSKSIRLLKIQLGLGCNYSCDYCSQKFVERAPETSSSTLSLYSLLIPGPRGKSFKFLPTLIRVDTINAASSAVKGGQFNLV